MGLTWPDGKSLLKPDRREHHQYSADNDPSFTLGADNVSPMGVAAADATLPARGIYCKPDRDHQDRHDPTASRLPVESAGCHRVMSQAVADAANYILQGDLTGGTATADAIGRPAASKTGTADQYVSAFFVGYTPQLLGAAWVGNPQGPDPHGRVSLGLLAVAGSIDCGAMYGSMAPGHTWQMTFMQGTAGAAYAEFRPRARRAARSSPWATARCRRRHPKPHHTGGGGGTAVAAVAAVAVAAAANGGGGGGHNGN